MRAGRQSERGERRQWPSLSCHHDYHHDHDEDHDGHHHYHDDHHIMIIIIMMLTKITDDAA